VARLEEAGAILYEWPADGLSASETCVRLVTSFATTEHEVESFLALL
jgi:threonine aldolase